MNCCCLLISCSLPVQAETRAEFAERSVAKLEKTIDDLEGELCCDWSEDVEEEEDADVSFVFLSDSLTSARNANMELQATLNQTMEELNSC